MNYRARHSLKSPGEFTILGKILLLEDMVKKVSGEKNTSKELKAETISDLNNLIDKYTSQLSPEEQEEKAKMTIPLNTLRELYPPLESTP